MARNDSSYTKTRVIITITNDFPNDKIKESYFLLGETDQRMQFLYLQAQ